MPSKEKRKKGRGKRRTMRELIHTFPSSRGLFHLSMRKYRRGRKKKKGGKGCWFIFPGGWPLPGIWMQAKERKERDIGRKDPQVCILI